MAAKKSVIYHELAPFCTCRQCRRDPRPSAPSDSVGRVTHPHLVKQCTFIYYVHIIHSSLAWFYHSYAVFIFLTPSINRLQGPRCVVTEVRRRRCVYLRLCIQLNRFYTSVVSICSKVLNKFCREAINRFVQHLYLLALITLLLTFVFMWYTLL